MVVSQKISKISHYWVSWLLSPDMCRYKKALIATFFSGQFFFFCNFVRMVVFIQDVVLFSRQPCFKKTMRIDAVAGFRLLLKLIVCHKMGGGPCLA